MYIPSNRFIRTMLPTMEKSILLQHYRDIQAKISKLSKTQRDMVVAQVQSDLQAGKIVVP